MKILSHEFERVSISGVNLVIVLADSILPWFLSNLAPTAIKVYKIAIWIKSATDPKLGRKVRFPPFSKAKVLPLGSVGLHFQLTSYLSIRGKIANGSKKSNWVIPLSKLNRKLMSAGQAILQKLMNATICSELMPPHNISSFNLKSSDKMTAIKIKLFTVLDAPVTNPDKLASFWMLIYGGSGWKTLKPFGIDVSALSAFIELSKRPLLAGDWD